MKPTTFAPSARAEFEAAAGDNLLPFGELATFQLRLMCGGAHGGRDTVSPRCSGADSLLFMKSSVVRLLSLACVSVLGACSSSDSSGDLPDGWGGAAPVKSFVQEDCPGSDPMSSDESASFSGGAGNIGVVYSHAHFRCVQKVEGFFKTSGDAVDILVQPIDMDPANVAACDCGYNITFVVEPVSSGTHMTTLYRRWDNLNHPNNPVPITAESVIVQ
jgi:hypothetical protein